MGKKSTLRLRATEEIRADFVENITKIAQSLQRRNKLAEEKTALLAYRQEECEKPEDLDDRA